MPKFTLSYVEARYCTVEVEAKDVQDAAIKFDVHTDLEGDIAASKPFIIDDSMKILDASGNVVYEGE